MERAKRSTLNMLIMRRILENWTFNYGVVEYCVSTYSMRQVPYQSLHCAELFNLVATQIQVRQIRTFLSKYLQRARDVIVTQFQLLKGKNTQTHYIHITGFNQFIYNALKHTSKCMFECCLLNIYDKIVHFIYIHISF